MVWRHPHATSTIFSPYKKAKHKNIEQPGTTTKRNNIKKKNHI